MMVDMANTPDRVRFFKAIPSDFLDEESGDVEAPCHHFGMIELDVPTVDLMSELYPDSVSVEALTNLPTGYYLIITDSNGLVWAWHGSEAEVQEEFDKRNTEYHRWGAEA